MSGILIFLLSLSGLIVVLIGFGIWWSIKSGQFEDMEGPAQRILMDDDDPRLPGRRVDVDRAETDSVDAGRTGSNTKRG